MVQKKTAYTSVRLVLKGYRGNTELCTTGAHLQNLAGSGEAIY